MNFDIKIIKKPLVFMCFLRGGTNFWLGPPTSGLANHTPAIKMFENPPTDKLLGEKSFKQAVPDDGRHPGA